MTNEEIEELVFREYKGIEEISIAPEPFRTVIAVYASKGIIDNGGFGYFFENDFPSPNAYEVICQSYRNIGRPECSEAIEKVLTLFPNSVPHSNLEKRHKFLSKYFDYENLHPTVDWAEDILDREGIYDAAIKYFRQNT